VQPLAGDRFYLRLLAEAGDLSSVSCHFADKYAAGVEGTLSLARETTDGVSDYWSGVLSMPTSRLRYFFEVTDTAGETRFFNEHGFHDRRPERKHHAGHFFYPYDLPVDRFSVPPWIAGRTFYLVFPDRFANGDQMNDPAWKRPWGETQTV
jgi:cyclomaltodextrinase